MDTPPPVNTPQKVVVTIKCDSAETFRAALAVATKSIGLDETVVRTLVTMPGGIERRETEALRVGDYLDAIDLQEGDSNEFTLTFHAKRGVASSWKYVVVRTLNTIAEKSEPGAAKCYFRSSRAT